MENVNELLNEVIAKKGMDYANGKVYTIRSPNTDKFYIGSTTQSLSKRMTKHRLDYNPTKKHTTSYLIFEFGDPYIELLEVFPCGSKVELLKREGELQRQYKDVCVNKNMAGRTMKEYYVDNKDTIIEQQKEYYIEHKDTINEQKKDYYIENKDKIKVYNQTYYVKHKDVNTARVCDLCGGKYSIFNKSHHNKTKKHLKRQAMLINLKIDIAYDVIDTIQ